MHGRRVWFVMIAVFVRFCEQKGKPDGFFETTILDDDRCGGRRCRGVGPRSGCVDGADGF